MDIDTTDLRRLAADLGKVEQRTLPKVRAVVQKTMLEAKRQMQAEAEGVQHAPSFPSTISYDTRLLRTGIVGEIGPAKGGAGSLALLYYGNSKTAPRLKDPVFAMQREADRAQEFFAKIAQDAL